MERLSVWVSAGLLSAGMSAAVLTGAGVAVADDSTSGPDTGSASDAAPASSPAADSEPDTKPEAKPDTQPDLDAEADAVKPDDPEPGAGSEETQEATEPDAEIVTETPEKKKKHAAFSEAVAAPEADIAPALSGAPDMRVVEIAGPDVAPDPVVSASALASINSKKSAAQRLLPESTVSLSMAAAAPVTAQAASPPNLIRWIQRLATSIVNGIGSLALNSLQALEALVTGPPALPANSTVTVRTSTILLSNGQRVQANWYYPEGDEVPERLILLQHGLLALGPMYSHTAADLAAQTKTIVVTPSLTSNFFGGDDHWLGGDRMGSYIADLFVGDREALTASALAAGFATRYGLDPATALLPEKFGLAGHSLGGKLVAATAGYLAEKGAADDLVGVITLDGVPTGTTMDDALRKLDDYEEATGRYIPIREIGAPSNLFNSVSNVKQALNAARPGRYNGVVLTGGVHMDSMRGGNPIIQFAAFIAAGFPQPQNPPAVSQLSATWFNEWFAGDTDNGDELVPGSIVPITTPNGTAQGVVIGRTAVEVLPAGRFVTLAV